MVADFSQRSSCTQRELLLVHLNFAARVIIPGRTFIFRLFQAAYKVKNLFHKIFLDYACKKDLAMWSYFIQTWNGISVFLDDSETNAADMNLYTDASGTIGFGGFFQDQRFHSAWQENMTDTLEKDALSIAIQELLS